MVVDYLVGDFRDFEYCICVVSDVVDGWSGDVGGGDYLEIGRCFFGGFGFCFGDVDLFMVFDDVLFLVYDV